MPRRDGFPTNEEMLADFNDTAREVLTAAYERQLQADLPPGYQDKPLSLMYLNVHRGRLPDSQQGLAVHTEQLYIKPLSPSFADGVMPFHLKMKDYPEDVRKHYRDLGQRIGNITLTDGLRLREELRPGSIDAQYTAFLGRNQRRDVSSFQEKPRKQIIASAKFFASEALEYVRSDTFTRDKVQRFGDIVSNVGDELSHMFHSFGFVHSPKLPLNGHESEDFLRRHQQVMQDDYDIQQSRLNRLDALGVPESMVKPAKAALEEITQALGHVTLILETR